MSDTDDSMDAGIVAVFFGMAFIFLIIFSVMGASTPEPAKLVNAKLQRLDSPLSDIVSSVECSVQIKNIRTCQVVFDEGLAHKKTAITFGDLQGFVPAFNFFYSTGSLALNNGEFNAIIDPTAADLDTNVHALSVTFDNLVEALKNDKTLGYSEMRRQAYNKRTYQSQ